MWLALEIDRDTDTSLPLPAAVAVQIGCVDGDCGLQPGSFGEIDDAVEEGLPGRAPIDPDDMEAILTVDCGISDSNTFVAGTNVPAVFRSGPGYGPGVVWSLVAGTDTVAHARLAPTTQNDVRAETSLAAKRQVVAAGFAASCSWPLAGCSGPALPASLPPAWFR